MSRQQLTLVVGLLAGLMAGCGGHYILTAPDQIAPAGGDAPVVVRLQRNDFFVLDLAWKDEPITFRIHIGDERNAWTDDLGYAGALVPAPEAPGNYAMSIYYKDPDGEELIGQAPVYVWDSDGPIIAIDVDALPMSDFEGDATDAVEAVTRMAKAANIIYMTRRDVKDHAWVHEILELGGYPSGPVLKWRSQRYGIARDTSGRVPMLKIESRLVSQLGQLKDAFDGLTAGITDNTLSAQAFADAGLSVHMVGWAADPVGVEVSRTSWAELIADPPVRPARRSGRAAAESRRRSASIRRPLPDPSSRPADRPRAETPARPDQRPRLSMRPRRTEQPRTEEPVRIDEPVRTSERPRRVEQPRTRPATDDQRPRPRRQPRRVVRRVVTTRPRPDRPDEAGEPDLPRRHRVVGVAKGPIDLRELPATPDE